MADREFPARADGEHVMDPANPINLPASSPITEPVDVRAQIIICYAKALTLYHLAATPGERLWTALEIYAGEEVRKETERNPYNDGRPEVPHPPEEGLAAAWQTLQGLDAAKWRHLACWAFLDQVVRIVAEGNPENRGWTAAWPEMATRLRQLRPEQDPFAVWPELQHHAEFLCVHTPRLPLVNPGRFGPERAGPMLPDTLDTLLAQCQSVRKYLEGKSRQYGCSGVRTDTDDDLVAFLQSEGKFPLPRLEPLWTAAWCLEVGDPPRWRGAEPENVIEACEALDILSEWCRGNLAGGAPAVANPSEGTDADRGQVGAGQAEGAGGPKQSEGEDLYAALREFARKELKGKQRAVIEALCDANGELPLGDLAAKDGVDWDDPFQGFKDAQRSLKPKLKKLSWELKRWNNTAQLTAQKRRK